MSYELSFTEEFFTGEGYSYDEPPPASETPTSVLQALVSMRQDEWEEYCQEVLNIDPEAECALYEAMDRIREVNTCTNLSSPVEVWLEPEGYYSVRVYDGREE